MSRAIDADRLLTDGMKSKYYHLPNGDIAIPLIDIEHAPTIEPERKTEEWIPCSKKLPEKIEKDYWVCTDRHGWQCQCKWRKFPSQRGDFWAWNTMARVVAWMPLPEPYQEREQDEHTKRFLWD